MTFLCYFIAEQHFTYVLTEAHTRIYIQYTKAGVHKLSRNLEATSKLYLAEGLHKVSSMLMTHSYGASSEPQCCLVLPAQYMEDDTHFST